MRWTSIHSSKIFIYAVVLFALQILLMPIVVSYTYAGRSENPNHVITYTSGKLEWDTDTKTDSNGSALLSIFDTAYENVKSSDDDKVIAPGTELKSIIRLKNSSSSNIEFTAVLYNRKSTEMMPVKTALAGSGFSDTQSYSTPSDINRSNVIRAIKGVCESGKITDFDISWIWEYEDKNDTEARDTSDTTLGDKSALGNADSTNTGFYIVVNDNGTAVSPQNPYTGIDISVYCCIILLALSTAVIAYLLVRKVGQK